MIEFMLGVAVGAVGIKFAEKVLQRSETAKRMIEKVKAFTRK